VWGDAPDQLKIKEPFYIDTVGTPDDVSDDLIEELGGGPRKAFVDNSENVYIGSYRFSQFKVFSNDGNLILNLSKGSANYKEEFFRDSPGEFYVDSNKNIYIISFPPLSYIPIINLSGNLVNKLYPCGTKNNASVENLFPNSYDVITIVCKYQGIMTYNNGVFEEGGSPAWKAVDGKYYSAKGKNDSEIIFKKSSDPNSNGFPAEQEDSNVQLGDGYKMLSFLGTDDEVNIYILVKDSTNSKIIQVYNTDYYLQDEITLPKYTNRYLWYKLLPFIRTDGNIYEFRCLDDGLHVIRWSREE